MVSIAPTTRADDYGDGRVRFRFAPYFWFNDYSGTVYSRGTEYDLNTDAFKFSGNVGGFLHIEAYRGKFAILFDHNYRRWNKNFDFSVDVAKASGWVYTTEIAGAYNMAETDITQFELLIGGRISHLKSEVVDQAGGVTDRSRTWFEGLAGGRFSVHVSRRLLFVLRGDIGGVLTGSDLTWNISPAVGYRLAGIVSVFGGYRIYDVDYEADKEDNLFKYDVQTKGPFLGFEFYLN
jgi:hypothetical protein